MTRRRWIADEVSDDHAALTGTHADHLTRVLRARVGQEFDIIASGVARRGRIASIAEGRVEFDLAEEIPAAPAANLTLLLAIFKFDRMEWAIEKCTELGVSRIVPLIARRTDVYLASASAKRAERWRRIALQAAEQSRRGIAPEVASPVKLGEAAKIPSPLRIVLAETEDQTMLPDLCAEHPTEGEVLLAVGPEGGWTEEELDIFKKEAWFSASLGPTILRAETAAIAATVLAISALNR
ncbi:MAG TPA: RsmE family RNA methyltransferase [Candidatus Sulfotelmatobacter sp.]|nr:RsmE family RNA methyltransferase [Candidatus Sulfotelmatobacter sp.]